MKTAAFMAMSPRNVATYGRHASICGVRLRRVSRFVTTPPALVDGP